MPLAQGFVLRDLDFSTNSDLKDLSEYFRSNVPLRELRLPHWDLNLVLHRLPREPFDPCVSLLSGEHVEYCLFAGSSFNKGVSELQA